MVTTRNRRTAWVFMILTVLISACNRDVAEKEEVMKLDASYDQTVEVVNPKQQSFKAEVFITGTAQPNKKVTIYAVESGVLKDIRNEIGDHVNRGQTIAVLENPNIEELVSTAISALAVGNARIEVANADIEAITAKAQGLKSIADRLSDVYKKTPQLTTSSDVESAQAKSQEAAAMVLSKKAHLQGLKVSIRSLEVNLDAAKKRQSFLKIKAPFSGTITKRFVDRGSLLQSGLSEDNPQGIVEIQETNPIRLTIPVPEADAVAIKNNMEVEVVFPELSGEKYAARISRTSNALDPISKTMQVEIDLENKDGRILTGMYAKVLLQVGSRENILSLPVIAKVRYKNEDYVLVVEDQKVKRVPIKIGLSDKDYFEVLSAEITKETQVIIKGKGLVNPGQFVSPKVISE